MDEHPSFSPLPHTIHLPSVVLSPSGLDLAEDTWVKRLARALGNDHPRLTSRILFEPSNCGRDNPCASIQPLDDPSVVSVCDGSEVRESTDMGYAGD